MLNSQFVFRPGTEIGEKFKTLRAESLSKIPLRVHSTMMFRPGSLIQPQEPILYNFDKVNEMRAAKFGTRVYLDGQAPLYTIDSVDENGNTNLAPFSFFNVFSAKPPIAIFSPNLSGRTGQAKDTHLNIK